MVYTDKYKQTGHNFLVMQQGIRYSVGVPITELAAASSCPVHQLERRIPLIRWPTKIWLTVISTLSLMMKHSWSPNRQGVTKV